MLIRVVILAGAGLLFAQPQTPSPNLGANGGPVEGPATNARKQAGSDEQVAVSKLPSVSIERDWVDFATLGFSFGLLLVGVFGIRAALATVEKMEGQINEMQEAGKQAARHLGLTERPWLSPTISLTGPLSVDQFGIHVALRVEVNNVGKSPATGIWIFPRLYFPEPGQNMPDYVKQISEQTKAASIKWGRIIFPGKTQR